MNEGLVTIHRALISVSDKTGLLELARVLHDRGVEILSTGGTAKALADAGIDVIPAEKITRSPEMLGGRVKTLHPAIHGGLLARRAVPEDMNQIHDLGIEPIDLVVVNLYPFAATISKPGVDAEDCIENIDIGGPSMLRSAAKNFESVAVVCDPADYAAVIAEMQGHDGALSHALRLQLAAKAFAHTAAYDGAIATWFSDLRLADAHLQHGGAKFPARLFIPLVKKQDLRYGENPHQGAALYADLGGSGESLVEAEQIQGKELSFNNYTDLEGAWQLASEFSGAPFCAIIKHANPCGAALGASALEAFNIALACDPASAFGGIIALNCTVDRAAAEEIGKLFSECLIAPDYTADALELLAKKKNLRVMRCPMRLRPRGMDMRKVSGGMLMADYDFGLTPRSEWKTATKRGPSPEEMGALEFAWRICKHVKSNAIVYANAKRILGVGAGQMSRVDSARIAAARFDRSQVDGPIVMASDAFFPFRDGLDMGFTAGATAVIQPGGSVRDEEVIAAADEHGMAMVFTGRRHFRH
jgi:phosphoribosylaminoimidazolecarboxamide formyltransferase/IMP cyclohydrolase